MKKVVLFLRVLCLASVPLWAHPHPNPADEGGADSTGLQIAGGSLTIGASLKARVMAETDTREDAPTSVFFDGLRAAALPAPGEEEGGAFSPLPPRFHPGHGGSAPSSGSGSASEDDFADGTSLRAELSAVFSRKEGGVKLTLRGNAAPVFDFVDPSTGQAHLDEDLNYFGFANAYGWFNLWDNMITVTAGIIGDGIFGTSALEDTATDSDYDAVRGLRLAVTPWKIPGFLFGAAWDFGTYFGGDPYFGLDGSAGPLAEGDGNRIFDSPASLLSRTRIGAVYIHERWGGVSVSMKPNGLYYNNVLCPGEELWHGIDLLFGIKVTAPSDFRFIFEGELRNLGIDDRLSKAASGILAGLGSTPLDAEHRQSYAEAFMPGYDLYFSAVCDYFYDLSFGARYRLAVFDKTGYADADEVTAYNLHEIRLFGAYQIFPWFAAGLETQFDIDGLPSHSYDPGHKIEGRDSIFKGFYLKPGFTFTLGEGLSFVLRDKVYFYNEGYVANGYADGGYVINQVQLDFAWSF